VDADKCTEEIELEV